MVDFTSLAGYLQTWGVMDFLLPFLLVFTIVFAVLQKTKIVGEGRKNFNVIIALIMGLLFVIPHITGSYPLGYDPVQVMNASLPSISLVSVAAIMLLLLMGIFGTHFSQKAAPVIAIVAIGFVIYIFGASLNLWNSPSSTFSWWTDDTTELVIVLLIFGLVVYFITKEPTEKKITDRITGIGKGIADMFERK